MGKQGPCYHCGITYTPLWRNGPPEKPVLCNACGSRWRTKGTLANYTPLHARTFEATDCSDYRSARGKKGSQNPKHQRSHKWKDPGQDAEFGDFGSDLHYATSFEEDASNRSSSGSGISYSEGCIQYGGTVGVDSAGSVRTSLWDSDIPAKKRTCMHRKRPSSVEKLTKGLRYILHEQDTSHLSLCSESEDLLFPCQAPMVAAEIGLGSMFIRQPQSTAWEEESEASSLVIASSTQLQNEDEYLPGQEKERLKHITKKIELSQEHSDRSSMHNKGVLENFHYNKNDLLQSCLSLLISVELKDIINFDSFMGILTVQDRAYLMEYVSPVDVEKDPESLQCMFNSVQFEEALTNFQDLLAEGIFDMYASRLKPHAQQVFQKLVTTELSNSRCMEEYFRLQRQIKPEKVLYSTKVLQNKDTTKRKGSNLHFKSGMSLTVEKSSGSKSGQVITGSDNSMKIPGNRQKVRTSASYHESMDTGCTSKSAMELDVEPKNEFCLSASSLFTSPLERNSILLDSIGSIVGESFDQDLLLDVPSNISFQQAELLQSPDWKCKASKDSLDDAGNLHNPNSGEEMAGNIWGSEDSLEWSGLLWNPSSVQSGQTLPNGAVLYSGKTLP